MIYHKVSANKIGHTLEMATCAFLPALVGKIAEQFPSVYSLQCSCTGF